MVFVCGYNFDDLLISLSGLLNSCNEVAPRGKLTKEIIHMSLELKHPCLCILGNDIRKQNVMDSKNESNSAYGWQLFTQQLPGKCISQYEYIYSVLQSDPFSRQAVINIHQISNKMRVEDVPCTLTIQFVIRNNRLSAIVSMRSCDLIWGLCNDVPFFALLLFRLWSDLSKDMQGLLVGSLCLDIASLHVYKRHFEIVNALAQIDRSQHINSKCLFESIPKCFNLACVSQNAHQMTCPLTDLLGHSFLNESESLEKFEKNVNANNVYPVL
jgi:thymidylate synthase